MILAAISLSQSKRETAYISIFIAKNINSHHRCSHTEFCYLDSQAVENRHLILASMKYESIFKI